MEYRLDFLWKRYNEKIDLDNGSYNEWINWVKETCQNDEIIKFIYKKENMRLVDGKKN